MRRSVWGGPSTGCVTNDRWTAGAGAEGRGAGADDGVWPVVGVGPGARSRVGDGGTVVVPGFSGSGAKPFDGAPGTEVDGTEADGAEVAGEASVAAPPAGVPVPVGIWARPTTAATIATVAAAAPSCPGTCRRMTFLARLPLTTSWAVFPRA
jgi:hypothetical protein